MASTMNLICWRGCCGARMANGRRDAGLRPRTNSRKSTWHRTRKGGIEDIQDISKYCGTKALKVAYSDGWGGNYWRQITRAEFEDEAAKCPNITEVLYTDGEFKRREADRRHSRPDRARIRRHRRVRRNRRGSAQGHAPGVEAGIAVVPFSTGDAPFGEIGKDYLTRVTETQIGLGKMLAEWMVKTLNGKGNVIVQAVRQAIR